MDFTRRDASRLLALGVLGASLATPAFAAAGPVRLPLNEFVAEPRLLKALRKGVAAMKRRKPSDPLSWFYQASIHGVSDNLWSAQVHDDPDVQKVDRAKYWNQCPHKGENSANFLPWHRAYMHHFEQILRMHAEEDDFAIPYWDYSQPDQREFPRALGVQHLDGNTANNDPANINPLFHAERDHFLCGYEHPFTDQLPLTELSARAVDASRPMNCPVFFGDTETDGAGGGIADNDPGTRGLFEQSPHDHLHRAIGGNVQGTDGQGNPSFAIGGMAAPPTAAFDPIFPIHHANMDRLWARWSRLPGKRWGKLPAAAWFDERPWFFFDTKAQEVNRPRRDYFDQQALGVRFKDDDPNTPPLRLPPLAAAPMAGMMAGARVLTTRASEVQSLRTTTPISAPTTQPTVLSLSPKGPAFAPADRRFDLVMKAFKPKTERMTLTLLDAEIGLTGSSGFDVYLARRGTAAESLRRDSPLYLGPISIFNHAMDDSPSIDQSFDITGALVALHQSTLEGLELVLAPYALATAPKISNLPLPVPVRRLDASGFSVTRSELDAPPPPMDQHMHQH